MQRRQVISAAALVLATASGPRPASAQSNARNLRIPDADYIEIQQLYARYCFALDKGNGDDFAALFTPDGEFVGGRGPGNAKTERPARKGTADLAKFASVSGTRHFNTNLILVPTADANTIHGAVYLMLYSARTIPPSLVETAICDDIIVKTPEGWKFKKRVVWRDDDDITPFKPKPLPAP
jgi:hypothetical protein